MAQKLDIRSHRLHALRHYSATELIAAGVDLRTVAGRLGHGSGGATTLRVYAAWSPSADERATDILSKRLPLPGRTAETTATIVNGKELSCPCGNVTTWSSLTIDGEQVRALCAACGTHELGTLPGVGSTQSNDDDDTIAASLYRRIAADLREQIMSGALKPGQQLPTVKELARSNKVSVGTARRALALLAEEEWISLNCGVQTTVRAHENASENDS